MKRIVRIGLAVASLLAAGLLPASPAVAESKIACKPFVGARQIDPIVSRGSSHSHHMHAFLGNQRLLTLSRPQTASYTSLLGAPTTCENKTDTAAYWVPALYVGGVHRPPDRFIAYYRAWDGTDQGTGHRAYPPDLRMVANVMNWTCGQFSSRKGPYGSAAEANCGSARGTVWLTAHIDFPTCWDGRLNNHNRYGNTADFAPMGVVNHLRYQTNKVCPAGFPYKVPKLRMAVSYGDGTAAFWRGKTVTLSSGPTSTMHADFWNTWNQAGLITMIRSCIESPRPARSSICGQGG
jgi:hypothetical protein